jgi:hypothetical protein
MCEDCYLWHIASRDWKQEISERASQSMEAFKKSLQSFEKGHPIPKPASE